MYIKNNLLATKNIYHMKKNSTWRVLRGLPFEESLFLPRQTFQILFVIFLDKILKQTIHKNCMNAWFFTVKESDLFVMNM